jgi:DNA-binding beta-propeller fold protein YncE
MRAGLALLVVAALAAAGCSDRARLNPFDPGNPTTGGRPAGFAAIADDGFVRLNWDAATSSTVTGFQVFRMAPGDTGFKAISSALPASSSGFLDVGLLDDLDYRYRLYFLFASGLGPRPAEDVATPGRVRPWVVDGDRHSLIRVTPDGRRISLEDSRFSGPSEVAVDNVTRRVWVSDTFGQKVYLYDPVTLDLLAFTSVSTPLGIAVRRDDRTAWVCDQGLNAVRHFDPGGGFGSPAQIIPVDQPIAIAIDPVSKVSWVCERGAQRLAAYAANGLFQGSVALDALSRVAVDSTTHDIWVSSFNHGWVVRVTTTPAAADTVGGLSGPIGLAVDPRRGRIWVADALADQVVALHRDGSVEFRVSGVAEARNVDVDLATGEAWVTAPGDGSVVRISPTGVVLRRLSGLGFPDGISIGAP